MKLYYIDIDEMKAEFDGKHKNGTLIQVGMESHAYIEFEDYYPELRVIHMNSDKLFGNHEYNECKSIELNVRETIEKLMMNTKNSSKELDETSVLYVLTQKIYTDFDQLSCRYDPYRIYLQLKEEMVFEFYLYNLIVSIINSKES